MLKASPAELGKLFRVGNLSATEPPGIEHVTTSSALYGIKFLPPAC